MKERIKVALPPSISDISLSPSLAEGLQIFLQHQGEWISVIRLREAGIVSVPYVISGLRKRGAVIDRKRKTAKAITGRTAHVTHFRYRGLVLREQ